MRDVWQCPVIDCGWEYTLPPNDGSLRYTRSLAAVMDSHADTHPPADYLSTIADLRRQLDHDEWIL